MNNSIPVAMCDYNINMNKKALNMSVSETGQSY